MAGTYGVLAYAVNERTHEIGVRMAVGAGRTDVLLMVLSRGAKLACAGVALGWLGAASLTHMMAGLIYGVTPTDLWIYAAVGLLLLAVAFLAAYFARRAASVDPMETLRIG